MELCYKPNLEGKVAVVTGGAGVLCKEFAKAMGVSVKSFYTLVSKASRGKMKKWTIEKKVLREGKRK